MGFLMQPIRRCTTLEEVTDSDVPMEPLPYSVNTPPAGMEQNHPHADSFDGQICAAGAPAPCKREYSPQASTVGRKYGSYGSRMDQQVN
ncbi:hypothetical protein ACQJBY_055146 [Aegilops geniculata]